MRSRNDRIIAFLMLLPSLILLAIFVYYFIGRTLYTSVTDWGESPNKPPLLEGVEKSYVGLDNYNDLMVRSSEARFRTSLVNTFFFTVLFIGGCIGVGFLLALLLERGLLGEGFFRTTFLFPMALSLVVTGTIWRWLFQLEGGVNALPEILLGSEPWNYRWLSSENTLLPFDWVDIPLYLTYIGVAVLAFIIFNSLSQENDRIGRFSGLLLQLFIVGAVAGVFITLAWGYSEVVPLWGAVIGVTSVVLRVVWTGEASEEYTEYVQRDWRPVRYLALAAIGVVFVYLVGLWDEIWLPLQRPKAEPMRGYNAALTGVAIAAVWQMSGYTMAMFLAGIRGIPEELREAARVDGCSEFGVYRSIILPMLRPVTLSAMIVLGHISLKIFDLVFAMGGEGNRFIVVPGILVYQGFKGNEYASTAAVAVIMLVLVSFVIIPYLWYSQRQEVAR